MTRIHSSPSVPTVQSTATASTAASQKSSVSTNKAAVSDFTPATAASGVKAGQTQGSVIRFDVNPQMKEIQDYANSKGWPQNGWTQTGVFAQDIVYTTDNWKTTRSLNSSSVPSPFVNGRILLPDVAPGTQVQFALHVYVASHAPSDIGGYRERGDLWLNNNGQNYVQTAS